MPRKSKARLMFTSRWMRWFLMRSACAAVPGLSTKLNIYSRGIQAAKIATTTIIENHEAMGFDALSDDLRQNILLPAMANDAGETDSYPQSQTTVHTQGYVIDDCAILGHTMGVVHLPTQCRVMVDERQPNWNEAKPAQLATRRGDGRAHYCLTSAPHYYHFFANDLAPLLYYLEHHRSALGPLTIVAPADAPTFCRNVLEALCASFDDLRVLYLERTERLDHIRALWLARCGDTFEWMPIIRAQAEQLSDLLRDHYKLNDAPQGTHNKLYVTRGQARLRRLHNEAEVIEQLTPLGFTVFEPRSDNHDQQVAHFRNADLVVAVHGAALTNLLFCKKGTVVVELFASDHVKSPYLWLATRLGLEYRYVIGGTGDLRQGFSVGVGDVVEAVRSQLS